MGVTYVDDAGQYVIEREGFGHHEDRPGIPRTDVTNEAAVRSIPVDHQERYAPLLDFHRNVLKGNARCLISTHTPC